MGQPLMTQAKQCNPQRLPATLASCPSSPAKQKGVVLFIALIALVAMTLAAIALVRSSDTANVIAGNAAFKQATIQASDTGVEMAFNALSTIATTSADTNIANQYFALQTDPATITWSNVPCRDTAGNTLSNCTNDSVYRIQYMIDRLCTGTTLPVTDIQGNCVSDIPVAGGGSKKANAPVFSGTTAVYYRVTIRVLGPRNTTSMVQALLSR